MGKVLKIGISEKKANKIYSLKEVEVIKGKGLINDRHFKENNHVKSQITLIEIENVDLYNNVSNTNIDALDFRRNIVTKGIKLNELLNKEFSIGNVKVKAHDLCRPCKYLQNLLCQKSLVDILVDRAGLRCEILSSGKIFINDIIKIK
tara:strand:+ start:156 stop:599 length:444 start_codon:yes stop_codon:yes gene_type:complete